MTVVKEIPPVRSFASDVSVDEVVDALKLSGGCIIKGILSPEEIDGIQAEVRPWLEADKPWVGNFFPPETRRCTALIGRSSVAAATLPLNAIYRGVCDAFLEQHYSNWSGTEKMHSISRPQLNNSIAISIGPGAKDQPLHRDDMCHQASNKAVEVYPDISNKSIPTRENLVGFFVAGKRSTKRNGATRIIPGSHLWDYERQPDESLAVYAELEPGDGFIMLGSAYHGGSANKSRDEERLIYSCFMVRGYLRQEENQYLSIPLSKVKEWPVELQRIAGYSLSEPYCGWVDSRDPRTVIDPSIEKNA